MANTPKSVNWSSGFKEVVTALLAFIIVVSVMVLLWLSLYPTVNLENAKGIFAILGGWVGVIIGYYFGRVPAEKGTDKANEVADTARTQRDAAVEEKVKAVADRARVVSLLDQKSKLLAMKTQVSGAAAAKSTVEVTGSIDQMIKNIDDEISAMKNET
jgi:hypothetical protein